MRLVIFKGEKSVNDLATRIFGLQDSGSEGAINQAANALMRVNPQLADLNSVPIASLIAIPDNAPAIVPDEQVNAPRLAGLLIPQAVQGALDALRQRLTDIEASAANRLKSGMNAVQTAEFKTALQNLSGQNAELANRLPSLESIAQDSANLTQSMQSAQESRDRSLSQLRVALNALSKQ